jgi:hypothetical protein
MKKLNYYAGLMKEAIASDKDRMKLYADIDMHRTGNWQTPAALKSLPWIKERKFASTKPADALDSGARTFASLMPKIAITPLSDDPREYARVEQLETALDWHFKRMNMNGSKTTHWRVLESAMRYCAVAMQTEYLPHTMKNQSGARVKAILRQSKFQWTVYHPSTVHSRRSKNLLEMAGLAIVRSAADLVDEFGEDNPGIMMMLEKLRDGRGRPAADRLMKTPVSYYDCTNWDDRCQMFKLNGGWTLDPEPNTKDLIELRLEEHKLPFIPWVVVDNEDPILKNAINTGLLDNQNIIRTILFSKGVGSAAESKTNIQTPDGTLDGVSIDNTNPTQPMVTRPGVTVQELRGTPIDPQLSNLLQIMEGEVSSSSVTQVLSDANALDSRNFSTANIKYRTAVAQLALARDCASRAEELGFYQMFEWLDYAKDKPLVAFREKGKTFQGDALSAGQEITITSEDFDLEHLYVKVELQEDSLMDEQSKWNIGVTQVDRFGMSRQVVAEELGVENYALHEQKRVAEELVMATAQAEAKKIMAAADAYAAQLIGQVQLQLKAAEVQLMQASQPPQQPPPDPQNAVQDMNAGASFDSMQGQDMRGGMSPAIQGAPGEGREQMNGADMMGNQLA